MSTTLEITGMVHMGREAFERLVREALDELPDEFAAKLDNVAVVVVEEPDREVMVELGMDPDRDRDELFGLYQGTPLTEREVAYSGLPDRVEIYMGPILRACRSRREVVSEVRDTVIHELGHHFGLADDEMPY